MRFNRSFFGGLAFSLLLIGGGCAGSASQFAVGDNVYGEWTSQKWYAGTIDKTCDAGFNVKYDDGDESCLAPDQLIHNVAPKKNQVKVGTTVIAKWTGTPFYDATVASIDGDTYKVKYYDGVEYDVTLEGLRLDPNPGKSTYKKPAAKVEVTTTNTASAGEAGKFTAGTPVKAIWKSDGKFYSGKIGAANADGTYDVNWDDGTTQSKTSVANIRHKVGTAVDAVWHTSGNHWSAKISKVNSDGTYEVTWDDGTKQDKTKLSELKVK